MSFFIKTVRVRPNHQGFLFKKYALIQVLTPGVYKYYDLRNQLQVVQLPQTIKLIHVINQEVLTKDNIALRFSFALQYRIENGVKYLDNFNLFDTATSGFAEAEQLIRIQSQAYLREKIASIESTQLGENREALSQEALATVSEKLKAFGLTITEVIIIDFTFPKMIQDLFAKELEAKIRAKSDLENARTTVATVRTLKNAADLMKQNEEMKFVQTLEMITKIAEKGKHTFHIGEFMPSIGTKTNQS